MRPTRIIYDKKRVYCQRIDTSNVGIEDVRNYIRKGRKITPTAQMNVAIQYRGLKMMSAGFFDIMDDPDLISPYDFDGEFEPEVDFIIISTVF